MFCRPGKNGVEHIDADENAEEDDFSVSDANMEDLEDFSVEDLSGLDLDEDI